MIAIAIDGPSSAGKSTVAKIVSQKLGYVYIDTGALYRAIALYAVRNNAETTSSDEITPLLSQIQIDLKYVDGMQKVYLNGEDVSDDIRKPEMSMAASNVSAIPAVREFLLDLQKDMAKKYNVIMDGRDIGTVVLPFAQVKIFLTASAEIRAKRRFLEFTEKGHNVIFEEILEDIKKRDYNDSHREIAPLKQAEDAILLDTSAYDCDEVVYKIIDIIREIGRASCRERV